VMLCMGIAPEIQRTSARRRIGRRLCAPRSNRTYVFHNSTLFTTWTRSSFVQTAFSGLGFTRTPTRECDAAMAVSRVYLERGSSEENERAHECASERCLMRGAEKMGRMPVRRHGRQAGRRISARQPAALRMRAAQPGPASLRTSFAVYSSVMRTVGLIIFSAAASAGTLLAPPAAITRTGTFLTISSGTDITRSLIG
jgi:hypothetical protein